MSFTTETEAKAFFVQRAIAQAAREGVDLTDAERHMLSWSESDPEFKIDLSLADRFDDETTAQDYETKVSGLIRRAYAHDAAAEGGLKAAYQQAYAKLSEGDHYILVMLKQALGLRLKKWWPF